MSTNHPTMDSDHAAMVLGLMQGADGKYYGACPACGYGKGFVFVPPSNNEPASAWCAVCRDSNRIGVVLAHVGLSGMKVRPAMSENTAKAQQIWEDADAASNTLVEQYLHGRGITLALPVDLRFAPQCYHGPTDSKHPAMLAAVRDACGDVVAVHRTFLDDTGNKADFRGHPNKMTFGPIGGAAIRLAPPGPVLWLAEGIETALSVAELTGKPCWAAISCGGIRQFELPATLGVKKVCIAADGDDEGQKAARHAVKRFLTVGVDARYDVAPDGKDFNDVLRAKL
jgi:phage/plasmid primase-like uncharacterized protein